MGLTHFNEEGRARMVDVSDKPKTQRVARAAGKVLMRPVLSREEADRLIDSIPSVTVNPVECHALRELINHYLDSVNTCDAAELLAMTMSIYAKKQLAIKNKKKLGAIDERFLREGESLLFGELSVSLGIPPEEVELYPGAHIRTEQS